MSALLSGLHKKMYSKVQIAITHVNHQPAIFYFAESEIVTCQIFAIQDQHVENIFFIRNPDKLRLLQKEFKKGVTFPAGYSS